MRGVINFIVGPFEIVSGVDFRSWNSGELVLHIRVLRGVDIRGSD